jgi:hypothetical protein
MSHVQSILHLPQTSPIPCDRQIPAHTSNALEAANTSIDTLPTSTADARNSTHAALTTQTTKAQRADTFPKFFPTGFLNKVNGLWRKREREREAVRELSSFVSVSLHALPPNQNNTMSPNRTTLYVSHPHSNTRREKTSVEKHQRYSSHSRSLHSIVRYTREYTTSTRERYDIQKRKIRHPKEKDTTSMNERTTIRENEKRHP